MFEKKKSLCKDLNKYIEKWGKDDPEIKKQLGMRYRLFDVFVEKGKWKKLLRHPLFTIALYSLRFGVAVAYLQKAK